MEIDKLLVKLDDTIIDALPASEKFDKTFLKGLSGKAAFRARAEARFTDSEPRFAVRGRAEDLTISNNKLPNAIRNTSIDFQCNNNGFKVDRLAGDYANGSFHLTYEQTGLFDRTAWKTSGGLKQFEYDHEVSMALSSNCKKFCHDFSPAGLFDLQFSANSDGEKRITSQITDMAFSFHRFPYQVEHCVGDVRWIGDVLDFNMQSIEQGQLLTFSGKVDKPGPEATYRFDFGTDGRLPIDEKLIRCLQKYPNMEQVVRDCLLYTSPSPRDQRGTRMPSSA